MPPESEGDLEPLRSRALALVLGGLGLVMIVHVAAGRRFGPALEVIPAGSQLALVDINSAGAAELICLPAIGPALAGRIIEYRERHGPFRRPEDLLAVPGIGPKLLAEIEPLVAWPDADPKVSKNEPR